MFKKVRNRILLLNMTMVSAVVIIAFAVIFTTTYTRVQNENNDKLHSNPTAFASSAETGMQQGSYFVSPTDPNSSDIVISGFAKRISPYAGLSFSLLVDSKGNVIQINSMVDLADSTYTHAATEVISSNKSRIVLEGLTWQYDMSPISIVFSDRYSTSVVVSDEYRLIRFLDITDSLKTLNTLALTLAGATVVILAVFFFISRFFADRAVAPMEESWEKQSRFIADASHELKTPLSVIGANCGALYANGEETVESQKKWVDSIMRASDRMSGLITNLLGLASMEDKETQLQWLPLDLGMLLDDILDEIAPTAEKKGIKTEKHIESDVVLESDEEHIRQLLNILLDNAVKYTDCGGEVSVSLKKEKRHVICEVHNTGEGISAENMPHLFDRFYRADPARSSENGGYGLGLSIAKSIANRLDIELTADSKPGEYTVFSLMFKLKP